MTDLKQEMTAYWTERAAAFAALRRKEFQGEKHDLWLSELQSHIPAGAHWRILDLGTGSGFFALLLAACGHTVTGIDLTEAMIREARRTARELGLPAEFLVIDAEAPAFAPRSFDAIVTRNLTWGLPHLGEAYRAWHGLLKPGGVLLDFDADYCREAPPDHLPAHHAHQDISAGLMARYESFKDALRPGQKPRPHWDAELLRDAGFHDVSVDTGVWKRVYPREDEFYNPTPIFKIAAYA